MAMKSQFVNSMYLGDKILFNGRRTGSLQIVSSVEKKKQTEEALFGRLDRSSNAEKRNI